MLLLPYCYDHVIITSSISLGHYISLLQLYIINHAFIVFVSLFLLYIILGYKIQQAKLWLLITQLAQLTITFKSELTTCTANTIFTADLVIQVIR